jgi:hypothetical protein
MADPVDGGVFGEGAAAAPAATAPVTPATTTEPVATQPITPVATPVAPVQTGSTAPAGVTMTQEQIAELIKGVAPQQAASQQQQRQYTQEEFEKAFNIWNPDNDFLGQVIPGYAGLEPAQQQGVAKAFAVMRDGLQKQFGTMTALLIQDHVEKLQSRYAPIETHYQETQREKTKTEFFTENADLKPFETIVDSVAIKIRENLEKEGKTLSRKEAFQAVADEVKRVLAAANIPLTPAQPAGSGQGTTQPQAQPATGTGGGMNPLSRGGQGGAGSGAAQAGASKNPGMSALD